MGAALGVSYRKSTRKEVAPLVPIIILPRGWEPDPKKAWEMLKIFLPIVVASLVVTGISFWLLPFTLHSKMLNQVVGLVAIAAGSTAFVCSIPVTLALPIWLSGLRGARLVVAFSVSVVAIAGLILGPALGSKWLFPW